MARAYVVDHFEIDPDAILGTGGFGQVLRSLDTSSGEVVAAKVIDMKRMRRVKILQEIQLMERVGGHSGIVGLRGAQEVAELHKIFIFMELAQVRHFKDLRLLPLLRHPPLPPPPLRHPNLRHPNLCHLNLRRPTLCRPTPSTLALLHQGGELFGLIIEQGKLEESAAVRYFKEMVSAVGYLHEQGVVHRDLKLENVLLTSADSCKLCDFGLAHAYELGASGEVVRAALEEVCGSKSYCAPEVLAGLGYDGGAADMWSLGICFFAMLVGFFPLDEAVAKDWRYARVQKAVWAGGSLTQVPVPHLPHPPHSLHPLQHLHPCILCALCTPMHSLHRPTVGPPCATRRPSCWQSIFQLYSRPCPLTPEAIALIDHLLSLSPEQRCLAPAVLSSPWVTSTFLDEQQKAAVLHKVHPAAVPAT